MCYDTMLGKRSNYLLYCGELNQLLLGIVLIMNSSSKTHGGIIMSISRSLCSSKREAKNDRQLLVTIEQFR